MDFQIFQSSGRVFACLHNIMYVGRIVETDCEGKRRTCKEEKKNCRGKENKI